MNEKYKNEIKNRISYNLLFWKLRIIIKKLLLKYNFRNISFCKKCGIDVRDFLTSDELWEKVSPHIENGNTLCYNCFMDLCSLNDIAFDLNRIDQKSQSKSSYIKSTFKSSSEIANRGMNKNSVYQYPSHFNTNKLPRKAQEGKDVLDRLLNR